MCVKLFFSNLWYFIIKTVGTRLFDYYIFADPKTTISMSPLFSWNCNSIVIETFIQDLFFGQNTFYGPVQNGHVALGDISNFYNLKK